MWCDNCLLLFPLRAGAMILGAIMALFQIGGGIFLFLYGGFYFTLHRFHEAEIYGGYSMAQGAVALIGIIALSSRSYVLSRIVVVIYPIILLLGAIRAGIMVWSFNHYSWRLIWSCNNDGVKWTDEYDNEIYQSLSDKSSFVKLPERLCRYSVENICQALSILLVIDFILMCYFYFLMWRFRVKLDHYPVQNNESVHPKIP